MHASSPNRSEDSRTGYLLPVRGGPGSLPDLESCWDAVVAVAAVSCHLEIQVDIQARKLYLEFFIWFLGRGERYLRMETGVLHRISIQNL